MGTLNRYAVQALFKDSLEYFTVDVRANDPVEAEKIVRHKSLRDLLIASVMRIPAAAQTEPALQ